MLAISLFDQLSTALVIGVITGAVYALVALGLVLVYKASGIFNFAQAEFGTVAVYAAYFGHENLGLPYGIALLLGVLAGVSMGLLTERFVIRPLFDAPRVTLLVATAGVALLAIGIEFWRANNPSLRVLAPISSELERISVLGIKISDQRLERGGLRTGEEPLHRDEQQGDAGRRHHEGDLRRREQRSDDQALGDERDRRTDNQPEHHGKTERHLR